MIRSLRRFRRAFGTAAMLLLAGCQPATSDSKNAATETSHEAAGVNPFAGSIPMPESDEAENVTNCVAFRLDVTDVHRGEVVNPRLHVENHCGSPAAVLTAPLEVVLLKRFGQPTTWPMIHAVYAMLYVQPKEGDEPRLNYLTDGGLKVLRLPRYFRVPAGGSTDIPVVGDHEALRSLEVGSYWLLLQTPVILDPEAAPMETPFDLGQSVNKHNLRRSDDSEEQAILMPPRAVRIGAATTLRVLPAP